MLETTNENKQDLNGTNSYSLFEKMIEPKMTPEKLEIILGKMKETYPDWYKPLNYEMDELTRKVINLSEVIENIINLCKMIDKVNEYTGTDDSYSFVMETGINYIRENIETLAGYIKVLKDKY